MMRLLLAVVLFLPGCLYVDLDARDQFFDQICPDGHCPVIQAIKAAQPNPSSNYGPVFEPWETQP